MARVDSLTNFLKDVADSIRTKKGTTESIPASNFDVEIKNLPSSQVTPDKGFVVNNWNSNGYPIEITLYGSLPTYYFSNRGTSSNFRNGLTKYLSKVTFTNEVSVNSYLFYECSSLTTVILSNYCLSIGNQSFQSCTSLKNINLNYITGLGQGSFSGCSSLLLTELPESLTAIPNNAFYGCSKIGIKQLPDGVTTIGTTSFYGCNSIVQLSMNGITTIEGSSSSTGSFSNCTSLKKVWIGNGITSEGIGRYCFNGCNLLEKIFINLPRATVETFTNYQYAFMNNTNKVDIIVCNDDTGFLTKEEFDNYE